MRVSLRHANSILRVVEVHIRVAIHKSGPQKCV